MYRTLHSARHRWRTGEHLGEDGRQCWRPQLIHAAAFILLAAAAPASACPPQPCTPGWSPTFRNPGFGTAAALLIEGDSLYAGGSFQLGPGEWPNPVIRWDGCSWYRVGGVEMIIEIRALCFVEEGGNRILHAGGTVGGSGGVIRYDGTTWSTLGLGFNDQVRTLGTLDGVLYAGGDFTQSGATTARFIARWDGARWNPVASGMNDAVRVLVNHDDGSGAALYAGGGFFLSEAVVASFIAKWDGTTWSGLGVGVDNLVACMTSYDDGNGRSLYAGGRFSTAGGMSASGVARWQAGTWSALGTGLRGSEYPDVYALAGFQGMLYVGGSFDRAGGQPIPFIARWTGSTWEDVGGGVNGGVGELAATEALPPFGPSLYVSGSFNQVGGQSGNPSNGLAQWTFCNPVNPCTCPGDADRSGGLNGVDIPAFVECLLGSPPDCGCADADGNGTVAIDDIPEFLNRLLAGNGC